MIATARPRLGTATGRIGGVAAALLVVGAALGYRVLLEGARPTAGFIAGAVFGSLLLAGARWRQRRPRRPSALGVVAGVAGGALLVALPRLLHPGALPVGMRPEPFGLWVTITLVVVVGEELLLRGVLFDATTAAAGPLAAVALTSVAFALIHVPLYGWGVVPLDLAVGVFLAGLRLFTGGVGAPVIAHALADLATW